MPSPLPFIARFSMPTKHDNRILAAILVGEQIWNKKG
jgi:hypothetical protein